jgi:hypothetical protein
MRPRRRVSRRGSHLSSLAHSHSGSIELQESARRDPSFELRWVGLEVRTTTTTLLGTSLRFLQNKKFCKMILYGNFFKKNLRESFNNFHSVELAKVAFENVMSKV